jgi:hypothetical protein
MKNENVYIEPDGYQEVRGRYTLHVTNAVAKRIRPNPCRSSAFSTGQLTNLIANQVTAGRNPLVPINSPFDASTLEKKFNSGALVAAGLESHLDPDRSRQNAITNLSQAIQHQLNSAQLRNSIESLQNPNRSIIKMNGSTPNPNQTLPATSTNPNTTGSQGSKSSTPLTEIPTPKSVIQQNQNQTTAPPSAVTPEPSDDITDDVNGQNDVTPASERNSVVRTTVDDAAAAAVTAAVAAQVTASVGAIQKDVGDIRRPTKSVISDSLLSDNGTETTTPVPQTNGQEDGQVSNEAQSVLNNFTNNHAMLNQSDGRDEDDINLAQLAQHKISSIVQNAVQNVTADALRNAVVAGNSGVAVSSAVQAAAAINSLTAVQSGHQVIQAQMAQHAAQMAQAQAQQAAQTQALAQQAQQAAQTQPPNRTDAEILKDNIQNMKQEDPDSDCELVETDIDTNKNGAQNNLVNVRMQSSAMVHRPLTFDPPTSMLGQLPIQSRTGSIGSLSLPSVFESRPVVSTSQNVIGNRVGVTGNNRVPITSVDKLAEQNGHKAELQALRQEANRGDEYLSMSRFVRTLSKIIFEPGELMVDSVKDIDKNKIAILLTETQRWYRANMAEVRQTLSIRLSEIRKSKRAAHWQTGRAQVMTQGWQFPQNGTMPRYMNDSRYFSLGANPITLDAARQRNGLALPDAANFTHIPNEMDA